MKKLVLLFCFIFGALSVFAEPRPTPEDLQACYEKNRDSVFEYKGLMAISLNKDLAAVLYDKDKKLDSRDYIKFDPYLGLYLVRVDRTLKAPFMMNELDTKPSMWVNILDQNVSEIGHIKSFGNTISDFDELTYDAQKPGLLLCDCCSMLGIAIGGNKFIGNRYIKHFMKDDDVFYGDIGVEFGDINGTLSVKSSNPFSAGKELLSGDRIVMVNNKIPTDLRDLNEMILFAPKNSSFKFDIVRNDQNQTIIFDMKYPSSQIQNQLKTGSTDTNSTKKTETKKTKTYTSFLPKYGIQVSKNATVQKVTPRSSAAKAGFRVGDKILAVDKRSVLSAADIEKAMRAQKNKFYFLVSRDDFQFFIRVYK
ncbi:DUF7488 domain-containing protein [Campylobacter hyointestinalis]|uniref:DUF7488 domain-containing protein n=1 Tax=Campylobacter hyointestinalis TaxID=198 RepID=UPI000727BBCA|nr:PDZ domain-containing protein [Campylobacter hyointestinalis]CUU68238.1 PDZ domain-containing protein [Campylobacter hyointestinalis subsp. hyointestinalis]CUU74228.1 PDZ domain-containing protein [Campylobacter hyointestinalis subsp. hyointestinalis]CUU85742.1 PDZ domain-containing protein [Campylobacter hyointestinalis subsp. hyointestinalis]CUU88079.1 PDZ domain-containing protein [Campylobacter hyointestinalis subsp. hyointestinalis]